MDAKDRDVLAATISVDADILLTQNTKHFPRMWMTERGIELLNAGELLTRLAEHFPEKTPAAHQQAVRTSRTPEAEIPMCSRAATPRTLPAFSPRDAAVRMAAAGLTPNPRPALHAGRRRGAKGTSGASRRCSATRIRLISAAAAGGAWSRRPRDAAGKVRP